MSDNPTDRGPVGPHREPTGRGAGLRPVIVLPITDDALERPDAAALESLRGVSAATASATLHQMGIRRTFISGPRALQQDRHVLGSAITLQFMPQREDIFSGEAAEDAERTSALWAVMESAAPGDVLLIQAYGEQRTGCVGEMLLTYLAGRGALGVVVDGCIRDWPRVRDLDLPVWAGGVTPNYASQDVLFPWAYNVPIACGGVLVFPGDVVIADGDGAVIVPRRLAHEVAAITRESEAREAFSRERLAQGGALERYYPLSREGLAEFDRWRVAEEPTPHDTESEA